MLLSRNLFINHQPITLCLGISFWAMLCQKPTMSFSAVESSLVYFSIHLQKKIYTEVQKIFSCFFISYINRINFAADELLKFKIFRTHIHRCQDHNNVIVDDLRRASHHTPNSFCFIHVSCPRSQSWPLNCKYNKCCKKYFSLQCFWIRLFLRSMFLSTIIILNQNFLFSLALI